MPRPALAYPFRSGLPRLAPAWSTPVCPCPPRESGTTLQLSLTRTGPTPHEARTPTACLPTSWVCGTRGQSGGFDASPRSPRRGEPASSGWIRSASLVANRFPRLLPNQVLTHAQPHARRPPSATPYLPRTTALPRSRPHRAPSPNPPALRHKSTPSRAPSRAPSHAGLKAQAHPHSQRPAGTRQSPPPSRTPSHDALPRSAMTALPTPHSQPRTRDP